MRNPPHGLGGARFGRRALLLLLTASVGACKPGAQEAVEQPLKFSHARHAKEDLTCLDCHLDAEKGPWASTLGIDGCMKCHKEVKEDEPEAVAKVREYYEKKQEIPWVQVNHLVGHVYFSHEAHVKWGEMECKDCHGDIASTTEPLTTSQVEDLSMEACMACHEERGANNDCIACHK